MDILSPKAFPRGKPRGILQSMCPKRYGIKPRGIKEISLGGRYAKKYCGRLDFEDYR